MANNYFIIHGLYGKPFENWFPWLEQKLSERKLSCIVPQFPTPIGQSYENWEKLLAYYDSLGFINADTIFVTHSLGSIFISKYVIKNRRKIKGLISAAGFNNFTSGITDIDRINESFFMPESELAKLPDFVEKIHCFISDTDPNLPKSLTAKFAETVNGKVYLISKGGHFNAAAGYLAFNEVFDLIKQFEEMK
jgi:uncharacterized protein